MIPLVLAVVVVPLLGSALTLTRPGATHALAILLGAAVVSAVAALAALFGAPGATPVEFGSRYFLADDASRLFLVTITFVYLAVALYARHRVLAAPELREHLPAFTRLSLAFLSMSALAVLCEHLVLTWVFIEATTLTAAPLICHRRDRGALVAAWRYLVFSTVGLALTLLGFVCLEMAMDSHGAVNFIVPDLDAADLGEPVWRRVGLAFVILGYGTKLGLAPMYAWLPEAYDAAPPSVTALLSAIQTSVVFLALMRILPVFRPAEPELAKNLLIGVGIVSMILSTLNIVAATNYKRLLAYAAMNHNAVVAVGLGVGRAAAFGVVLYLTTNALVKAILFLACGNIKARYRTKEIAELRALVDRMPYSGALFMLGTFALLGFAPFGSFLGEVMVMGGLIEADHPVMFILFGVLFTVVLVATGRSLFPMIWGESKQQVDWRGEPVGSLVPALVLLGCLVLSGLSLPSSLDTIIEQVATTMSRDAK